MRSLTRDDILSCARGYYRAEDTTLGLELLRFEDGALGYYRKTDAAECRSRCPAGVVLDFFTDSRTLSVVAGIGMAARSYAFFNLYVDDCFVEALGAEESGEEIAGTCVLQPNGEARTVRVTLYLPQCRVIGLRAIALDDDAAFAAAPARPVLLALGDSITQGMSALHPALSYPMVCARALGMTVHNYGVGGHIFDADSLPGRPVEHPAQITVAYGINDFSRQLPVEAARPFLARVRALYPSVPVTVLAPLWSSRFEGEAAPAEYPLSAYREDLRAIVAEFPGMSYLSARALLPPADDLLIDGVHPTTAGHAVCGLNLATRLSAREGIAGVPAQR